MAEPVPIGKIVEELTFDEPPSKPLILPCGHESTCYCFQCHVCEDVTQDDD